MVNELGHKIYEHGIEVDNAKVAATEKMPCPKDIKGIRSFLGHVVFYRRFIKDFSKISWPLTNLLQKDIPFVFDDDCLEAFETLKKALIPAICQTPPDEQDPVSTVAGRTQGRFLCSAVRQASFPSAVPSKPVGSR